MFELDITYRNGEAVDTLTCTAPQCELGKARTCILRLRGWKVAPLHARIEQSLAGLFVEDISRGYELEVNGRLVQRHGPLTPDDLIGIGGYLVRVRSLSGELDDPTPPLDIQAPEVVISVAGDQAAYMEWSKYITGELFRAMDLRRLNLDTMSHDEVRTRLAELVDEILEQIRSRLPKNLDSAMLHKIVLDEAVGLGPLEDLLADESITEIMVNRHDDIYVERAGRLERSAVNFSSDAAVMATIERIISPLGRRIDESSPMVDARLKDGSRVNAIIPPLALRGPCLTIRKFSQHKLTTDDLLRYGSINEPMVHFLRTAVEQRMNIVVSGGTGSGKTTLLNILSNFIPPEERVVTVEDAAELKLVQPHVVSLESRPANMEGKGHVTIRDLVRNCLRMRPDRIVVGECRGGEALDMLQAMNTGHDGSLTTGHANTPRDMLRRLEVMVLMAGMDLPLQAIREQISSAVQLIVQQSRFGDGSRRITSITEVTGMEQGTIQLNEIFCFRQHGFDQGGRIQGSYQATGQVPEFYEALRNRGVPLDMGIFKPTLEVNG
ncbi:ATPase, T2SS/T4P/T4SS family [Stutzerimonas zhaodongensis]|jgi:pilus assembly protein CpaF|uniref:CpaF family protein n=1 Tax=Stutzerimonas zhaodongensis TaxID=1176257 RepID=A0A365PWW2_9GAMM|nr:ATPase, T2SS/T4P/T4SS family [Stutzerimonas zhaodongensis]QWV17663.1 Flp pilus assembly complex ATPase component TadA [Stutzerimonas zhaodongensis]RBA60315.1 CpaF family protein [Stutzerimonas zhaodongensis]